MLSLIKTEIMKELYKKSTYFFIGSILLVALIYVIVPFLFSDNEYTNYTSDWQTAIEETIDERVQENESLIEQGDDLSLSDGITFDLNSSEIVRLSYHLENDIEPPASNNYFESMTQLSLLNIFIALLSVIIASNIIPKEFNKGTIKLLLIRPFTRNEVILSKYIVSLIFTGFFFFILYFSTFVLNLIFNEMNPTQDLVLQSNGEYFHVNFIGYFLGTVVSNISYLIIITTVAFAVSCISLSSKISLGFSVFLIFGGYTIVSYVSNKTELAKYLLMANWNFSQYLPGGYTTIEGMTITFSILINLCYLMILLFLCFYTFNKRDIDI